MKLTKSMVLCDFRLMAEIDDYQQASEDDDEDVIRQIIAREKEIMQSVGSEKILEKVNLNKLNDKEVIVIKKMMDQKFTKNQVKPTDSGFQYDIEKDFDPEESNEWDKSVSKGSLPNLIPGIPMNRQHIAKHLNHQSDHQNQKSFSKPTNAMGADEEFDIDFDEDFNDDLDDFDD